MDVGVVGAVRMPLGAVRLEPVGCGDAEAAEDVHLLSHWFEMVRIHAGPVPAQVVKLEAGGYLSDQLLVCVPVGDDLSGLLPELAVPAAGLGSSPLSAQPRGNRLWRHRPLLVDLRPEALGRGRVVAVGDLRVAPLLPTVVMHRAEALGVMLPLTVRHRATGSVRSLLYVSVPGPSAVVLAAHPSRLHAPATVINETRAGLPRDGSRAWLCRVHDQPSFRCSGWQG